MIKNIVLFFMLVCFSTYAQEKKEADYQEKYRPQFHFSPASGWIGDPDGLVYTNNKFHMYWWGHAVSEDLVYWQELPYPMKGDDGQFSYFSGSVVVDKENTSGFGEDSMIAFYTKHFSGDSIPETQAISVSRDGGLSYHYYEENPILDINKVFFRDPQVFWYDKDQMWKMVVSLPDIQQIHIYESNNLKQWDFCSSFGNLGAENSFWECPDLFELPVLESEGVRKWVMLIGRGPNRVQYFVGDFDGKRFIPDGKVKEYLKNGTGLNGLVYDDFEGDVRSKWENEGMAFKNKATSPEAIDYLGNGYLGDLSQGEAVGKLISKPFTIAHTAINFLIAGGNHPDSLAIQLVVNGKVERIATGDKTLVFKWNDWDVSDLIGKEAHFEIIDSISDSTNGAIAIDHIVFSNELMNHGLEHALWLDYGNDYYATRTWRNYDDTNPFGDHVYAIGWMGNWDYSRWAPTSWGKGFQSLPRVMALKKHVTGYRVVQCPISQLKKLRQNLHSMKEVTIEQNTKIEPFKIDKNTYEIEAEFKPHNNAIFGFNLLVGEGRKLALTYDPPLSTLCLDRTNCTDFTSEPRFNDVFSKKMYAPLTLQDGKLRVHIFIDQASVEVFTNDGEIVLSAVTFPSEKQLGVEVFSENGNTEVVSMQAWEMNSIW